MFNDSPINRRSFGRMLAGLAVATPLGGCASRTDAASTPDKVWGKLGAGKGQFSKPRAISIDAEDNLYIVDMTARIQVFDADGTFIRMWQMPEQANGRPTGMTISSIDGNLMVADTHYYRILTYTPQGELLEQATLGGTMGLGEGEFGFVTDVVRDKDGNYFVSEYGEFDRIQKFSPDGEFLLQWGGHGDSPGHFMRPQHLALDDDGLLWVADACNHRIQVFDRRGNLQQMWGKQGIAPGELSYPYCLVHDGEGSVYVCEYGNHRVQKLTRDGKPIASWGREGRKPGQLFNPWSLVLDSERRCHVLDSMNHRVQRFYL